MDKLKNCRLFLLDMDGTLYLGGHVFPGTPDFLRRIRERGSRFMYFTNNSSRTLDDYVNQLHALGLPNEREDVFTAGLATGIYLRENHPGKKVCLVGTRAFRRVLEDCGVEVSDGEADVVVAGLDAELTYHKLERAIHFLRKGAAFVAANPDLVCPMPGGEVIPDTGSICALLTAATDRKPYYVGKPNRALVDMLSALTGVPNEQICCVGDRLYTDIAAAKNAGGVSVLVLTGETDGAMLRASDIRPDYVFPSVAELAQVL